MPEEVNSWGTYEQTAKQARLLSNRRVSNADSEGRSLSLVHRRASLSSSVHGSRRLSAPFLSISRSGNDLLALQEAAAAEEGSSELGVTPHQRYSTDWSHYFDKLNIDRHKKDPIERRESKLKNEALSIDIIEDVKRIFSVYFEGSYHDSLEQTKEQSRGGYVQSFLSKINEALGQVYFQNNPVTGLLILIGLFVQSTRCAIHGIIAVICGNLTAHFFGFDKGLIRSGLFGYNSFLVGLALSTFYSDGETHRGYSAAVAIATVAFSSFSSALFVVMGKLLVPYKSPPLTLPFNVAAMMYLLATANMSRVRTDPVRNPALPDYNNEVDTSIEARDFFAGVIRGVGQVFLADDIVSGVLVFLGIAVCSRISAFAAIVGSALGAAIALATGVPGKAIESGLYGFNSSLSFTAMLMFYNPSYGAVIMGTLAGVMTVFGQQALSTFLEPFGLPVLTLPFCVVALPFIILQGTTSLVVAVPLSAMTVAEDHLRKVKSLRDGFNFLREALHPENAHIFKPTYSRKLSRDLRQLSSAVLAEEAPKQDKASFRAAKKRWKQCFCAFVQKNESNAWVQGAGRKIFLALDVEKTGHVYEDDFLFSLQAAGLNDRTGQSFATLVFGLMDFDRSNSIEQKEFVAFAMVSWALVEIIKSISKFFDFVDADGNDFIELGEIDDALEYLGEPCLTEEDRATLVAVTDIESEEEGIDVVELINYVTIAKIKAMVSQYHTAVTDVSGSETP